MLQNVREVQVCRTSLAATLFLSGSCIAVFVCKLVQWYAYLAYVVRGAVVSVGFQAALAVTLHVWLGVHVWRGRVGGRTSRAAGVLRPITDLPQTHTGSDDEGEKAMVRKGSFLSRAATSR